MSSLGPVAGSHLRRCNLKDHPCTSSRHRYVRLTGPGTNFSTAVVTWEGLGEEEGISASAAADDASLAGAGLLNELAVSDGAKAVGRQSTGRLEARGDAPPTVRERLKFTA